MRASQNAQPMHRQWLQMESLAEHAAQRVFIGGMASVQRASTRARIKVYFVDNLLIFNGRHLGRAKFR